MKEKLQFKKWFFFYTWDNQRHIRWWSRKFFISGIQFTQAITMKTTKSNEEPIISHTYEIATVSWGLSRNNILLYKAKEYQQRSSGCFQNWGDVGKGRQISIYADKFQWHPLVILCYCAQKLLWLPDSIAVVRLSLHFLGIWKLQSNSPFSYKTDPKDIKGEKRHSPCFAGG